MKEPRSALGSASFSGHETFVFRYAWLYKATSLVPKEPRLFNAEDAMVKLGVGKNMVRSIRHWALATKVLEEKPKSRGMELRLSSLGSLLFGSGGDPYLEDANTLWLLHWNLTNNPDRATTWSWAFNLFPNSEFTRDSLGAFIANEVQRRGLKLPSDATLKRDVECFVRTYATSRSLKGMTLEDSLDCPLSDLGLLDEDRGATTIRFTRGERRTLSDYIFAACLLDFWQSSGKDRETLSFADIAFGPGSPGKVFRFDEESLLGRLEKLEIITKGALVFADTAGLKQVYKRAEAGTSLLDRYYKRLAHSARGNR